MTSNRYSELNLKEPKQSKHYGDWSNFVISTTKKIIKQQIASGDNKIVINTSLKLGLPMENINKLAGPLIEAWAFKIFSEQLGKSQFQIVNIEAGERLNMTDIVLQVKRSELEQAIVGNIDVKSTSQDIPTSGKSPNITSFARMRSAYIQDPNFIFIVLSLKHKMYSSKDESTGMINNIMEVIDYNSYDLKHISSSDISYNPALGTGQVQIRDIHYVKEEIRTTFEFCKMLDQKVIASKKGFDGWYGYAKQNGWIEENE